MAIAEACQVWIEQRLEEELEEQSDTGKSLRAIGRELAEEIEKVFETKVKPGTLTVKAHRMQTVTNVTPHITTRSANEIPEESNDLKESNVPEPDPPKKAKDGTARGGKREGAGRPGNPPQS